MVVGGPTSICIICVASTRGELLSKKSWVLGPYGCGSLVFITELSKHRWARKKRTRAAGIDCHLSLFLLQFCFLEIFQNCWSINCMFSVFYKFCMFILLKYFFALNYILNGMKEEVYIGAQYIFLIQFLIQLLLIVWRSTDFSKFAL